MNKPYTYLVTNRITEEYYYGSRYKNVKLNRSAEDDLWIYYFTSSNYVHRLITEYGKESFDIQILLQDADYVKCYDHEQSLIKEHIDNNKCLNVYYRITNKFSTAGLTHTQETKDKIRQKAQNRLLTRETKDKISKSTIGIKKTTEHIKNAADGRRGKKNINPAWNKDLINQKGHPNPLKGTSGIKMHTQKSKDKIGASHKGRIHTKVICPHCNKEGGCTSMKRWHFDNCKDK